MNRTPWTLLTLALAAGAAMPLPAQTNSTLATDGEAQPEHRDNTGKRAGEIVTQPVRDIGIDKKKIPPILAQAVESPYAAPRGKGCAGIKGEITNLNAVLGPDFGQGTAENESKLGKAADIGGSAIVNSLIPFRGLVREVSGAAPADRRFAAAVSGGIARRGYLHGLAEQRCGLPKRAPLAKKK